MQKRNNTDMPIFKAAKRIACLNAQMARQVRLMESQVGLMESEMDTDGIAWRSAKLVSGLTVRDGKLYSKGRAIAEWADECYAKQYIGFCDDSYYGQLYFRTDVPGQYVCVNYFIEENEDAD